MLAHCRWHLCHCVVASPCFILGQRGRKPLRKHLLSPSQQSQAPHWASINSLIFWILQQPLRILLYWGNWGLREPTVSTLWPTALHCSIGACPILTPCCCHESAEILTKVSREAFLPQNNNELEGENSWLGLSVQWKLAHTSGRAHSSSAPDRLPRLSGCSPGSPHPPSALPYLPALSHCPALTLPPPPCGF